MTPKKKFLCAAALASIGILAGGAAFGQASNERQSNPEAARNMDTTFARHAAYGGMAEVKLGELAEQKGASPAVKNFGRRMVNDHSKANTELKDIAAKNNVALPEGLDKKDQATYDRLTKLSGPDFDRVYMRDMVSDHQKDISDFKQEADSGKNQEIRNFASETLPTLQSHLQEARTVQKDVSPTPAPVSKPAQ